MQEIIYLLEKILDFISAPFIDLVNISITASWVVLAVLIVRFCLKKAPKWLSCALWGVVALRLIFPFALESELSLIPSTQTINPSVLYNDSFEVDTGFSVLDNTINNTANGTIDNTVDSTVNNIVDSEVDNAADNKSNNTVNSLNESAGVSASAGIGIAEGIAFVWLMGMFVMASYAFISFLRLKFKLRTAVKKEGNIYQSEFVDSPFVLGLFRPRIYLPYKTDKADIPLVIEHEKAHVKRFDHIIKPLGYLLLSVHWFNPLVWVAYILLCRDIEAACDEKVIKNLGEDVRKSYSTALLNASISRRSVAACPLAFGEVGVKERIKGVMNYKKPAFWVVVAGVAACIIAAVCLLTNPMGSERTDYTPKISDELDRTISLNVIEHNQSKYLDGMMSFEAHKVLATKTSTDGNDDKIITVYIVALYEEYSVENGELVEVSGGMSPLALSYLVEEDISTDEDTYALTEYWEPGMGSEYVKDLEAKFPKGVNYDTQKYVEELQADCRSQAIEYFGLDMSGVADKVTQEYTTVRSEETDKPVIDNTTNGVTADISPEAEPQLTGKVTSATDKVIYMELTYDQGGIKQGTPVTVRLGSMLSYAPEIDTSKLKKGDFITVIYDGLIMETYPLQINAYAVYKKDDTVFDTKNIARITFYAYYGYGKGSDVPAENMAEIKNWLSTFTVGEKAEGMLSPGTNTYYVEIEYLDGTIVKQGLDTVSVDGVRYYLKHADAPDCFSEIISKTSIE